MFGLAGPWFEFVSQTLIWNTMIKVYVTLDSPVGKSFKVDIRIVYASKRMVCTNC